MATVLCFFSTIGVNQAFASYRQQENLEYRYVPQSPGTLTLEGRWKYYDRDNDDVRARRFYVELFSGTTFLQGDYTDNYGYFVFSVPNPRRPVKVIIYTYYYYYYPGSNDEIMVVEPGGTWFLDCHSYTSDEYGPYSDGYHYIGTLWVPSWLDELDAWWIKADLDIGYTCLPDKVGPFIADWDPDWSRYSMFCVCFPPYLMCDTLGHIQLASDAAEDSPDTVLHEMGHAVMWHVYDEYWPMDCWEYFHGPPPLQNCIWHNIPEASGDKCAWTEGWASFWAIYVKGNPYLLGHNLETPTWGTPDWDDGDEVEGRVAGALLDIYDYADDGFDQYDGGFDDIWDTVYNQNDDTFVEFWEAWKDRGHNQYDAAWAIFQNTICAIPLYPEWNLVSLPLIPENNDIEVVLADLGDSLAIVQHYNASAAQWFWYIPGNPSSDLETIDDGLGYWFFMNSSDTLIVSGSEEPPPGEPWPAYDVFAADWNQIGFKSTTSMSPEIYLASIDGDYSLLQTYNATSGEWPWYIPGNPASTLTTMEPGYGYWLWATADGTIVPPDGDGGSKSASDGDGAILPDKADLPTFPPPVPPYGPNPPLPPSSYTSEAE